MIRQTTRRMLLALLGGSGSAAIVATPAQAAADDRTLFATRADAEASHLPFFQEFLRTSGYWTAGDGGGGLYRRVAQLPEHPLSLTTADGAHWELVPEHGIINVLQAGARGDGVTDDAPAFMTALSSLTGFNNDASTGLTVMVPPTPVHYRCASTLNMKHRVRLIGHGFFDKRYAQIVFDKDIAGIVVNNSDSVGLSDRPGPTTRATWSAIEGIAIRGGGTNPDAHGFVLRTKVRMRDCMATFFPGDGFHIAADSREKKAPFGNTNHSIISGAIAQQNGRHGMYVFGPDTNAMTVIALDATGNGRFGLWDESLLGNTYVGAHIDANGIPKKGYNGEGQSCQCTFEGNRYCAHYSATGDALLNTRPGTDSKVWVFSHLGKPGRRYPQWTGLNPPGSFHAGGSVAFIGRANRGLISGYVEPHQGGAHFNGRSGWIGGHIDAPGLLVYGTGKVERGSLVLNGGQIYQFRRHDEDEIYDVRIRAGADDRLISFMRGDDDLLEWFFEPGQKFWALGRKRDNPLLTVGAKGHEMRAGRSATIENLPGFPQGIVLGDPSGEGRACTVASGPAQGGEHAQGEIRFNNRPEPGGHVGWVCVQSGSPGEWRPFGRIET